MAFRYVAIAGSNEYAAKMSDEPSDRVIQQRLHNRYMEELYCLADWEKTLKFSPSEYFNRFFDWLDFHITINPLETLTNAEVQALMEIRSLMKVACDSTREDLTEEQLISSGWPERIKPIARSALALMMERGWFSEEQEERHPSLPVPWPAPSQNDG